MCLSNLGEVNRLKGNLDKAKRYIMFFRIRCLEESLEIREQLFGDGHIDVAGNVENLGTVYFDMGDFHRARKNFEKALIIKKSKLNKDAPEIAITLSNIGKVYPYNIGNTCRNMNELDKARKYYQDA